MKKRDIFPLKDVARSLDFALKDSLLSLPILG